MSAFSPIPPRQAAERLQLADIPNAEQLLSDFAAADLLRTYARVTETIHSGGRRVVVRDATIPADLWRRIIAEGKVAEVLSTGTARLDGSPQLGTPTVTLVGIRINEDDVLGVACQHGAAPKLVVVPNARQRPSRPRIATGHDAPAAKQLTMLPALIVDAEPVIAPAPLPSSDAVSQGRPRGPLTKARRNDAPDPNALWITVNQAMALTGLGRTKINELMIAGSFRRKKVDRRTLIERVSVDEFMSGA